MHVLVLSFGPRCGGPKDGWEQCMDVEQGLGIGVGDMFCICERKKSRLCLGKCFSAGIFMTSGVNRCEGYVKLGCKEIGSEAAALDQHPLHTVIDNLHHCLVLQ